MPRSSTRNWPGFPRWWICKWCSRSTIPRLPWRWTAELAGLSRVTVTDVAQALVPATSSSRFTVPIFWADPNTGIGYQVQVEVPPYKMNSAEQIGLVPIKARTSKPLLVRRRRPGRAAQGGGRVRPLQHAATGEHDGQHRRGGPGAGGRPHRPGRANRQREPVGPVLPGPVESGLAGLRLARPAKAGIQREAGLEERDHRRVRGRGDASQQRHRAACRSMFEVRSCRCSRCSAPLAAAGSSRG